MFDCGSSQNRDRVRDDRTRVTPPGPLRLAATEGDPFGDAGASLVDDRVLGRGGAAAYSADVGDLSVIPDFAAETPAWISLMATAVGALQGALLGRQHAPKFDLAGVAVLALLLGFGGGVIRDILIGNTPPEALRRWEYIAVVGVAFVAIMVFGKLASRFTNTLFVLDALTMGLFAAVGAQYAINFRLPELTAILVGSFAAVGGGVVASLMLRETPAIMRPGPPYAIAAVAGTIGFVLLDGINGGLASLACIAIVFAVRILSERLGYRTSPIRPLD